MSKIAIDTPSQVLRPDELVLFALVLHAISQVYPKNIEADRLTQLVLLLGVVMVIALQRKGAFSGYVKTFFSRHFVWSLGAAVFIRCVIGSLFVWGNLATADYFRYVLVNGLVAFFLECSLAIVFVEFSPKLSNASFVPKAWLRASDIPSYAVAVLIVAFGILMVIAL